MAHKVDLLSFFNLNKPVQRIHISGPQVGGVMATENNISSDEQDDEIDDNTDYAREFQEQDAVEALEMAENHSVSEIAKINDVDDFTTVTYTGDHLSCLGATATEVYKNYNFDYNSQVDLPINYMKEKIVTMIEANQVVIIEGATGCGKSTQVPQFILDSYKSQNKACNIIVTQPRRIAAISIARRIAEQRKWPLGSVVGYQVGLYQVKSDETLLTYVTTGILLQKLVAAKSLNDYTHIILDEVHERDKDMDFLMLVVRKFLRTNSRNVKVILMSATIDVTKFSNYFTVPIYGTLAAAPIIQVERQSKFKIQTFYLDELSKLGTLPLVEWEDPTIKINMYRICAKLIKVLDHLDIQGELPGSVLVFLPGIHEIEEMDGILQCPEYRSNVKYEIIPLHSTITTEEQKKVFIPAREGFRKIILSTNIAESSITVPDIKYVIDFCLTKNLFYDPKTSFTCLQMNWAAKSNCKQRAGRAGRVADGRVYRLIPERFYNDFLEEETNPEMLRCPLDILILLTKRMNLGPPPHEILALALDPPRLDHIERTILILKEIGALLLTHKGYESKFDGDMTFLGHIMAALPLDIRISKMIILGYLFSCFEESVIMAAGMSTKNVFSTPFKEGMKAYNSKLSWADGTCSDLLAILNVYKVWKHHTQENLFTTSKNKRESIVNWSRRHFLQYRVLDEMDQLIKEIKQRLNSFNVIDNSFVQWNEQEKPLILKIIICGAFYPNYFVRIPNQIDEKEAIKILNGRAPNNTVYLQGMEPHQPGRLYASAIKNGLGACGTDMHISFDNSNKVYVQFKSGPNYNFIQAGRRQLSGLMPGHVAIEIYRSVRHRQLYKHISIPVLSVEKAVERAKQLGIYDATEKQTNFVCAPELPGLEVSVITIKISHVIDPDHFWAQYWDVLKDGTMADEINESLNASELKPIRKAVVGKIYAAPFDQPKFYYRARCDAINFKNGRNYVSVFYVDYGNDCEVLEQDLRELPSSLEQVPAQAFECVLCELKPSLLLNSRGVWINKARELFYKMTHNKILHAQVYSVTQGVVSLELFENVEQPAANNRNRNRANFRNPLLNLPTVHEKSINKELVKQGYAQHAEESYLSKWNHEMREAQLNMEKQQRDCYNTQQKEYSLNFNPSLTDVPSPTEKECRRAMILKGPFSPLETRVYSVNVSSSHRYTIHIDQESVNTVLLDTEPQDTHERLLVAASVSTSPSGSNITLRYTTLMPNLHGFSALMALLFCYKMELRTNEEGTKYTAALCGLGCNPATKKALLREHDLLVNIDVELDKTDINMINSLRYYINAALQMDETEATPYFKSEGVTECQRNIQVKLLELLRISRKSVEIVPQVHKDTWGHYNEATLLKPAERQISSYTIYPLHSCIDLDAEAQTVEYKKNIAHLLNISKRMAEFPPEGITCKVCDVTVLNIDSLRVHLVSTIHKNCCEQFEIEI